MATHRFFAICLITIIALATTITVAAQRRAQTAPESFVGSLQAKTEAGATGSSIRLQIDRYTSDTDRKTVTDALQHGGYPAFLLALRGGKQVGHVEIGSEKFPLRFATEQPKDKGRAITLVTDAPIFFVGGGRVDAKPRAGFEIAVVQLTVDDYGMGYGSMAAAARVKPDGAGGVQLEDYAEYPIKVTFVHREIK